MVVLSLSRCNLHHSFSLILCKFSHYPYKKIRHCHCLPVLAWTHAPSPNAYRTSLSALKAANAFFLLESSFGSSEATDICCSFSKALAEFCVGLKSTFLFLHSVISYFQYLCAICQWIFLILSSNYLKATTFVLIM